MQDFKRYAIYWAPSGAFAQTAAQWLGWDPATAQPVPQPDLPNLPRPLADLTADPRKYGFHGTIKAPFRLAEGLAQSDLSAALSAFCAQTAPITLPGLELTLIEHFLALIPKGDATALNDLASRVVTQLDRCRAPLTEAEIARRRPERLTPRQRDLLATYGYPHVLEAFQFHLTLSGPVTPPEAAALLPHAKVLFAPVVPHPFPITDLCLFAEDQNGRFHLLERHALTGPALAA
jgi:putative phosphonate metabolism protein